MTKFISVGDASDFAKISDYIKKNRCQNYYIAPKLMCDILLSPSILCAIGVHLDDIKFWEQEKFDIIAVQVYNKVLENTAFKINAIKRNGVPIKPMYQYVNDTVIFGMNEEAEDYNCCKLETINEECLQ